MLFIIAKQNYTGVYNMINKINNYFSTLKMCIDKLDKKEIEKFISILLEARDKENQIFIMGNGGSGTTASHFCCDFNKGMSFNQKKRFKMICLNDNVPTVLAYSNDVGYDIIFTEQLKNFMNKDDVVIGISGSGNSQNIINAIEYANSNGGLTVGLTGYDGGKLKKISKYSVNTNICDMQITEDIHLMLCHLIYSVLMKDIIKYSEGSVNE